VDRDKVFFPFQAIFIRQKEIELNSSLGTGFSDEGVTGKGHYPTAGLAQPPPVIGSVAMFVLLVASAPTGVASLEINHRGRNLPPTCTPFAKLAA